MFARQSGRRLVAGVGIAAFGLLLVGAWLVIGSEPQSAAPVETLNRASAQHDHEPVTTVRVRSSFRGSKLRDDFMSGWVRSTAGAALADASVCLLREPAACCVASQCVATETDGHFVMQPAPGNTTLFVSAPGHLSQFMVLDEFQRTAQRTIRLKPSPAVVSGRVMDATGGPVPGATLSLLERPEQRVVALGVSDELGEFSLGAPSGELDVVARAEAYAESTRFVYAPARDVVMVLAPGSSLPGRVVDDSRQPVAGMVITARSQAEFAVQELHATTAADGSFELTGLSAGEYALSGRGDQWYTSTRVVAVGVGERSPAVHLSARRAASLDGVVRVSGAGPCEQGEVQLRGRLGLRRAVGFEGAVRFEAVPPGRYGLQVRCAGAVELHDSIEITDRNERRTWELDAGLTLTGSVVNARGAYVPAVPVSVRRAGQGSDSRCVTDERGEFSCAGLVLGEYDVVVGHPGAARGQARRVLVEPPVPRLELQLEPQGTILVSIDGAASDRGASAGFAAPLQVVARATTGLLISALPRGEQFVFEHVPLGSYQISVGTQQDAEAPGGASASAELEVDGQTVSVSLRAPEPLSISGQVTDAEGLPVPDCWVYAFTSGVVVNAPTTVDAPSLTDEMGRFVVAGLMPGRYEIRAQSAFVEGALAEIEAGASSVILRVGNRGQNDANVFDAVSLRVSGGDEGDSPSAPEERPASP